MKIRPIETKYNGYRFRSRLETRWAVFFDALDIKYEYEPEGFDLGELGWYLPDFLIYDFDGHPRFWIEIKSVQPSIEEIKKIQVLDDSPPGGATSAHIFVGLPAEVKMVYHQMIKSADDPDRDRWVRLLGGDGYYALDLKNNLSYIAIMLYNSVDNLLLSKIQNACYTARGARFEHAASG